MYVVIIDMHMSYNHYRDSDFYCNNRLIIIITQPYLRTSRYGILVSYILHETQVQLKLNVNNKDAIQVDGI